MLKSDIENFFQKYLIQGLETSGHNYRPDPFQGEFRASQLPYSSRKIIFSNTLNYEVDTKLKLAGWGGDIIHLVIQTILQNSNLKIITEGEIKRKIADITIFGHYDVLIIEYQDILYCLDIKSIGTFSWLDEKQKANFHHVEQLNIYLSYLVEKYPSKTVIGILWYILRLPLDPDTQKPGEIVHILNPINWRLFEIPFSLEIVQKLVAKAIKIHYTIMEGHMPENDAESWECQNRTATCPYLNYCYHNHVTTINQLRKIQEKTSKMSESCAVETVQADLTDNAAGKRSRINSQQPNN